MEAEEKQSGGVWVSFDNVLCAVSCVVVRVCVFVSEKEREKGRESVRQGLCQHEIERD